MTDSQLPPWAPRTLYCKEVFGLWIRAAESFEMPEVAIEYPCGKDPDGHRSIRLTPEDAEELAGELRRAIEAAVGKGLPTRRSVFLHHIHDEDAFDAELGAWAPLDPAELMVYANRRAVVLHRASGDIPPVMSDLLSAEEAAAVEEESAEIDRRGYRAFEIEEFASFHPIEARQVVEVLEAAIAAFDRPSATAASS